MDATVNLSALIATAPWQMWASFAILAATITAFASERFEMEHVAIATVAAFLVLFEFAPLRGADGELTVTTRTILEGFADPALLAIMGLLILSQGLFQSGTMEMPNRLLAAAPGRFRKLTLGAVLVVACVVSGFVNDTPVVVMFLPIVAALAASAGVAPSRVLMPLSFLALLGGMTTLIGSSTNILAAGIFTNATGLGIGFWDLSPLGGMIALTGAIYLATAGRLLLPRRGGEAVAIERDNKQFVAQFEVTRGHFLLGKRPVAGLFPDLPDITVRMVQRREEAILPPYEEFAFLAGDIVIVAATREALTRLLKQHPEILGGVLSEIDIDGDDPRAPRSQLTLVEAVVAPNSRLAGRTIAQIGFHYQTNCVILGVERRSRMIRAQLSAIRLEAGDVLLILGPLEDVRRLRGDRDVLLMETSMTGLPAPRNAVLSGVIFVAVVVTAALGVLPIGVAAICGVLAMLAFGCLNIRQAARAFDRRIYLLIGSSLAMGHVLDKTGGAVLIGGAIAPIAENFGAAALLSAMFLLSAVVTNLLSNNATVALLMPIAVSAAQIAGVDPFAVALTVIYGANCPFATPIAYQTNLLVMSPGHYKFSDFIRVGGPLVLLVWIVYSFAAPAYFSAIGRL
jgi:di/tricarboxylate transporter